MNPANAPLVTRTAFTAFCRIVFCAVLAGAACGHSFAQSTPQQAPQTSGTQTSALPGVGQMALTTKSERARQLFNESIVQAGNYRIDECLNDLRGAVKEDPTFASAWAVLSLNATDSKEAAQALEEARKSAGLASPSEQLLVRWIAALKSNYQIGAITSLNDLIAAAPKDKNVLYLGGRWFFDQNKQQRAVKLFESALQVDPNYTPVLNRLGYAYASMGQFAKAAELMQRYVAAMPDDPNPEDSYGDILFKAGRYDEAQTHFEAALKKDPKFGPSQHELGDVFAMKGDQEAARVAYRKAATFATNPRRSIEYRSSIGLTYVREGNLAQADKEFSALAAEAKAGGYSDLEASLHLTMARYQQDAAASLKHLSAAEDAVRGDEHMATAQRDEWMAVIRRWRGMRSMHQGNSGMTEVCLRLLQDKSEETENDEVSNEYHALQGAWFANQKKYSEAAPHLEEAGDTYSLALLSQVKTALGDTAGAEAARKQLLSIHESTIDGVLVVEPARTRESAEAKH